MFHPLAEPISEDSFDQNLERGAGGATLSWSLFTPLLGNPALSEEDYRLHRVAREWRLATSLQIHGRGDFRSLPSLRVTPFDHQIQDAIAFFRRLAPRGLIADDVGLGKTVTAGLIVSELLKRRMIRSLLVVCPGLITGQWKQELRSKFDIDARVLLGREFRSRAADDFVITTYPTARDSAEELRKRPFDMIILDEAHRIRRLHGPAKPSQQASRFLELFRAKTFRFVLQLTATPLQTSPWDIYSLADHLRVPEVNPFGTPDSFRLSFLEPAGGKGGERRPLLKPGMKDEFRLRLGEIMIRTRRGDTGLSFPARRVHTAFLEAHPGEASFIHRVLGASSRPSNPLERTQLYLSALSSPWAAARQLKKKLETSPEAWGTGRAQIERLVAEGRAFQTSAKLEALKALIRELRERRPEDWRVAVFTSRLETLDFIQQSLEKEGLGKDVGFIRGGQAAANQKALEDFAAGPPRVHALLSTDAGAEGVNLQSCNVLVNYDLPWNPMHLEQRIGRIQRLGQTAKEVVVYTMVVKDTVEEHVIARLMERVRLFEIAIGDMEGILSEAMGELGRDDAGHSYSQMILKLVDRSLERRDIKDDLERAERSMEAARRRGEEVREAVEGCLGRIDPENGRPPLPTPKPAVPEMSLEDFTLAALARSGGELVRGNDGQTWRYRDPTRGLPESVLRFPGSPGVQASASPAAGDRLYTEESECFQRLLDEWTGGRESLVYDTRSKSPKALKEELAGILGRRGLPAGSPEIDIVSRTSHAVIEVAWKATLFVRHDQVEKVLTTWHPRPAHGLETWPDLGPRRPDPSCSDLLPVLQGNPGLGKELVELTSSLARTDPDLRSFGEIHEERLKEELARWDRFRAETAAPVDTPGEEARNRMEKEELERRFTPELKLTPIGIKAALYEIVEVDLTRPMGARSAKVRLGVVPLSGILMTPWVSHLTRKPLTVPSVCIGGHLVDADERARCAGAGCALEACRGCAPGILHRCVECSTSWCPEHREACVFCSAPLCPTHAPKTGDGKAACTDCAGVCAETGARLKLGELALCEVSGQLIRKSLLETSEVSRRLALPRHMAVCQESGMRALPEELEVCEVTKKRVLPSLLLSCPDTRRKAQRRFFRECPESKVWVLPEALGGCEETGQEVRQALLGSCSVTGRMALNRLLRTSEVSGRRALRSLGVESTLSGRWALLGEVERCEITGDPLLPGERVLCDVTGKRVRPDLLGECAVSHERALKELLLASEISDRRGLPEYRARCLTCQRRILTDERQSCQCCQLPLLCRKCQVDTGEEEGLLPGRCRGCDAVLDPRTPLVDKSRVPPGFPRAFPKGAQWRYKKVGRLHYGLGVPSLLGHLLPLSPPELIVLEERGGTEFLERCRKIAP